MTSSTLKLGIHNLVKCANQSNLGIHPTLFVVLAPTCSFLTPLMTLETSSGSFFSEAPPLSALFWNCWLVKTLVNCFFLLEVFFFSVDFSITISPSSSHVSSPHHSENSYSMIKMLDFDLDQPFILPLVRIGLAAKFPISIFRPCQNRSIYTKSLITDHCH